MSIESTDRFLRPPDLTRTRRSRRRVQAQRILVVTANLLFAGLVVIAGVWAWQRMQSDTRFTVRRFATEGAVHTSRHEIDALTGPWLGENLFRLDIASLAQGLETLPWVRKASIEKRLPDTMVIHIEERVPVALVAGSDGVVRYADSDGTVFAKLTPVVGNPELPIVIGARREELPRAVAFLAKIKAESPDLYTRISEVTPVGPGGFAVLDRSLSARVFMDEQSIAGPWRTLHQIAAAEGYGHGAIEYADLRFRGRVVVKPVVAPRYEEHEKTALSAEISN